MGRCLYDEKIGNIVDDDTAYRRLTRDPTTRVEKVAEQIRALHRKGLIPDQLKDQPTPGYSNPPQIYDLPKIHKDGTSLRPIVLSIGTLQVKEEELPGILSLLTDNTSSFVKSPVQLNFVEQIRNIAIDEKEGSLVSFDVVSLLTKVPIDEALDVLALGLKEDNTLFERTAIPPEDIHRLAELCYA